MFTYNTSLEPIKLRAYGRQIQEFLKKIKETEDKEKRTQYVEFVVRLMKRIDGVMDAKEERNAQIWNDLFVIANYDLDVNSPYPIPEEKEKEKPEKIPYVQPIKEFKRYGRYLVTFVREVGKSIGKDSAEDEKLIPILIKMLSSFHKKEETHTLLEHLEEMMGKKVTITPQLQAFLEKPIFERKKYYSNARRTRKRY